MLILRQMWVYFYNMTQMQGFKTDNISAQRLRAQIEAIARMARCGSKIDKLNQPPQQIKK